MEGASLTDVLQATLKLSKKFGRDPTPEEVGKRLEKMKKKGRKEALPKPKSNSESDGEATESPKKKEKKEKKKETPTTTSISVCIRFQSRNRRYRRNRNQPLRRHSSRTVKRQQAGLHTGLTLNVGLPLDR